MPLNKETKPDLPHVLFFDFWEVLFFYFLKIYLT